MNKKITLDALSDALASSRTKAEKSQKYMAQSLGKSLSTIQNWENGVSAPNMVEMLEWFEIVGVNPLRHMLDIMHPETFGGLSPSDSDEVVDTALRRYINEIATYNEKRKIAYCVFGGTGSSWPAQVDELCALDHLPIIYRVSVAESIYNLYQMLEARGELRGMDHAQPDMDNLRGAIDSCKKSVLAGKKDYFN